MAAGTSVCRRFSDDRTRKMSPELPTTSIAALQLSSSLLKRFSQQQQQQQYWRLSSFPLTTRSSITRQQFKAPKKLGSDQNCCLCVSLPPPPFTCSFKFSIFGGPLQSVLRSQSIVQMHINRMLFGGLQVGPVRMATVDTDRKGTTLPPPPPPLPHKESVGDSSGGTEMAATPDVIHRQLHNDITFQEADHESGDSDSDQDSEDDEYDCDSDSEGDEGSVQFSPELDCDDQTDTLTPNPVSYMSLYSDESGFCENSSDSQGSFEEWSDCDNESDTEEIDCEANDSLWNSFEQLAISPLHVCAYQDTQTCPIASANRTDSNDTDTTLETFSDTEGMECTINIPSPHEAQCEDNQHVSSSKHVTFKPDSELVVVHRLIAWDYAYRACRRGPWEEYARDRMHFKRRIESVACVLEPCLAKKLSSCPVT